MREGVELLSGLLFRLPFFLFVLVEIRWSIIVASELAMEPCDGLREDEEFLLSFCRRRE